MERTSYLLLIPIVLAACSKGGGKDQPGVEASGGENQPGVEASGDRAVDEDTRPDDRSADVPDAVSASPGNYQVVAENDAARLIVASWKPGEKDALHAHPHTVHYVLTDGKAIVHGKDGGKIELELEAGTMAEEDPVAGHQLENAGDSELKMVMLERKEGEPKPVPEGAAPAAHEASKDVYQVLHDNDWVRVLRATWKPGSEDEPHSHPELLVYVLDGGETRIAPSEGKAREMKVKAGAGLALGPAASHTASNLGEDDLSVLLFELK